MKKIVLFVLIITLGAFGSPAFAGAWSMISGMAMPEIKPQAAYTIDTAGINPRIYEFDTKVEPIKHCVVLVASSDKMAAPTMQCFNK